MIGFRLIGLVFLGLVLFLATSEAETFRYGRTFELELERSGMKRESLEKAIINVRSQEDFLQIPKSKKKNLHFKNFKHLHRYVFTEDNTLFVDSHGATDENVLPFILIAQGKKPLAAGLMGRAEGLFGKNILLITNRSKRFCTPFQNLKEVQNHLKEIPLERAEIILQRNKPKSCESIETRQEKLIKKFSPPPKTEK